MSAHICPKNGGFIRDDADGSDHGGPKGGASGIVVVIIFVGGGGGVNATGVVSDDATSHGVGKTGYGSEEEDHSYADSE